MSSKWIRKDDQVLVISGNDKGKVGKVLKRAQDRVVVQGINVRKKHIKKSQKNKMAQILDMEMSIPICKVALANEEGKKLKVFKKIKKDGEMALVYEENGKEVVFRTLKK